MSVLSLAAGSSLCLNRRLGETVLLLMLLVTAHHLAQASMTQPKFCKPEILVNASIACAISNCSQVLH